MVGKGVGWAIAVPLPFTILAHSLTGFTAPLIGTPDLPSPAWTGLAIAIFLVGNFTCYLLVDSKRPVSRAFRWSLLVPMLTLDIGVLTGSLALSVIAAVSAVGVGAEAIYTKYVVNTVVDDAGSAAPALIFTLFLAPQTIIVPNATLLQLLGAVLQSALVLAGLIFSFAIFYADRPRDRDVPPLFHALGGFLQLFISLAVVSMAALLFATGDLDISQHRLFATSGYFSGSTVGIVLLLSTLALFISCLAYLVVILRVLFAQNAGAIAPRRGRPEGQLPTLEKETEGE